MGISTSSGQVAAEVPVERVPRVARLMALAIKFEGLLRSGSVSSLSELAHVAHVTQPRMTQIMNLLHLAPDIQEALLQAPVSAGRENLSEHMLRSVVRSTRWSDQRAAWRTFRTRLSSMVLVTQEPSS